MEKDLTEVRAESGETYSEPKLEEWGSVTELTQTGRTQPGSDGKGGSSASSGV